MDKIKIAFYKTSNKWYERLIVFWQYIIGDRDYYKYNHVEIIIDKLWYTSTNYTDKPGVMIRKINPNPDHWDYVELIVTPTQKSTIHEFFKEREGQGYDWLAIFFAQVLNNTSIQDKKKWFCSEICAAALSEAGVIKLNHKPAWYNPARLRKLLKRRLDV